jgi:SUN family beta-glucosidase
MKLSQFAILGTIAVVSAQHHRHAHRHADKHPSPVEGRSPNLVTTWVPGPTETVYVLNGKKLDAAEVAEGIAKGYYILVPEKTTSTSSASSTSSKLAAEFFQQPTTSSASPTPTSTYVPPPSSSAAPATPTTTSSTQAASSSSSSGSPGGTGLGSSFPSGQIPCSTFPSAYGPVAADWLKLSSWTGIQYVPGYSPGHGSISQLSTANVGSGAFCAPGSFCSYGCPPGYQKSQWPSAQGSTGQSIGGLYCNSNGMLELSRPSVPQLCVAGTGQVKVQNKLGTIVSICRTDYPGTESETIALGAQPGQTNDLTCPDANNYYMWQGSFTSAQYYVNPSGVGVDEACQWQTADHTGSHHGSPGNVGNWAPVNLGVGRGPAGTTYISMFQNAPTNPYGTLDFSITLTGDISGSCSYSNGQFWNNGVADPSGCTVSLVQLILAGVIANRAKVLVTGTATYVLS